MQLTLLYFAALRDLAGTGEERLTVPEGAATVEALGRILESHHPRLLGKLGAVRFAVNEEFAALGTVLKDGDTVALIPPVQGG